MNQKYIYFIFLITIVSCTSKSRLSTIALAYANKPEKLPDPNKTISKDEEKSLVEINQSNDKLNPPTSIEGNLIQTGGSVLVLARELTIDLEISGSNVSQILAIKEYIHNNWHYIHDPDKDADTWRSAETTIALRYKNKFPGDCDDFAILLASLARQIGLKSRVVGGFYQGQGHAFAEFKIPQDEIYNSDLNNKDIRQDAYGYWVSLDWFIGDEHNQFTDDILIFDE
jgi:hypothetical protein